MAGILIDYAKVSTCDQQAKLAAQVGDLTAAGCERMFAEQAVAQRDRLNEALLFVRRWYVGGDKVRKACSTCHRPSADR
jgi:hypothetical protein